MEKIFLAEENLESTAARAAEILRAGGVVLFPTDTLYGLGADALSDEAVAKIYAIKGREEKKPIHAIVADMKMAEMYAETGDIAHKLAAQFFPGALTLILKKKPNVVSGVGRGIETIGIRIPDNAFCLSLARAFGAPVTATSANRSGEKTARSVRDILVQLGERVRYIDLAIDVGELPERKPSTVVDVRDEPFIVREGAIAAEDIWNAIRALRSRTRPS